MGSRFDFGETYRPGWVPTLDELRAGLRESAAGLREAYSAAAAKGWAAGRYEGGWNAKELLAHVASIEWTYPRLIEVARTAATGGESRAAARDGVDAYNARQVAKRAEAAPEDLLAEFERNREQTLAAVDAAEPEVWAQPIESAGGFRGPLVRVLYLTAVEHVRRHTEDLRG